MLIPVPLSKIKVKPTCLKTIVKSNRSYKTAGNWTLSARCSVLRQVGNLTAVGRGSEEGNGKWSQVKICLYTCVCERSVGERRDKDRRKVAVKSCGGLGAASSDSATPRSTPD